MTSPDAIFYDGLTARRRAVTLAFGEDGLAVREGGAEIARWPYGSIRRQDTGGAVWRARSLQGPDLARLEVEDPALRAEVERRAPRFDDTDAPSRRNTARIVGWSFAAAASLVLTAIYLVPVAANLLAPLIPVRTERWIGDSVEKQARTVFGGETCTGPAGIAALERLAARLQEGEAMAVPARVGVLSSGVPNAFALPGGRVYLLDGLIRRANDPDELAGVLAHEIGHVAHRDGMRRLIQAGGTSFLFGLLFGDVTGSGALIFATRLVVDASYSREAETQADAFAKRAMGRLGRSARPMGVFLVRLTGQADAGVPAILRSHPVSGDRLKALGADEASTGGPPLLSDEEWRAVKSVCKLG